ncbi:hypothetical protein C5S31_05165 [ANME-1 cluster archaeon GoMg2]|nr:hypothetical protein [ANME-1 cluster archaeon GoMg2]
MPRQARLDAPGSLHHILIRGIERKEIVKDDHDRQNFVYRLVTIALETGTLIYVWTYAISYNRRHRRHGHLFQNRYKSIIYSVESCKAGQL